MESQNTQTIKISAVIPAYNCEKYIARAIESVLGQTHPVEEIIVIDDGSTDNTAQVVRSFDDKVTLLHQENAGASAARNAGIQAAKGNWIAFLDADDEWLPDRIKLQVELLNRNPNLVWISGNYLRCLCNEKKQKPHITQEVADRAQSGKEYFDSFFAAFLKNAWGCTDTMLVKKEILLEVGLFEVGQHQMEDMDLWWRIALKYPSFGYIPEPIAIYHLGIEGSLIQSQKDFSLCRRMIRKHLTESQKTPHEESVKTCSVMMLKRWMRSMLFNKRTGEIQKMLTEFNDLFSPSYKWMMRLLVSQPAMTARCLRLVSRIVRFLKIRQQLTRKPKKLHG